MNKFMRLYRSAIHDGGAAPAAEPEISHVEQTADGVMVYEAAAPVEAAAPAASVPAPSGLSFEQLMELERARGGGGAHQETKPDPAPTFDATRYIVGGDGEDAGSIDMKALGAGVNDFVQQMVERRVNEAMASVGHQFGGTVQSLAAQQAASTLASKHGLGDKGKEAVLEYIGNLDPVGLMNMQKDPKAVALLVGYAKDRERSLAALEQESAPAGGGGRGRGTALKFYTGEAGGWESYCRVQGADPKDPAVIKAAKAKGVLV